MSHTQNKVWKTREVLVGSVGVGGSNPIRIQSMTTSLTKDVEKTVDQIMKLSDSGCEIARVTVQGKKEAFSCESIKNNLLKKGYTIPLVADIHFYPPAAMIALDFVDKVRINPGNYIDKRATFKTLTYTDDAYRLELQKIEEGFASLVEKALQLNKALRIGTNHGSLSDRIMNRFGDTPKGMVESALEFARVCRKLDFHNFVFSMKASNPLVMIEAYRLLVQEMLVLDWDYPLHLGVTEAGEGEDGRIKSAVGIGSLLLDGIGDTIRVSLTEDPWHEIKPCQTIVNFFEFYKKNGAIASINFYDKKQKMNLSKAKQGLVYADCFEGDILKSCFFKDVGFQVQLNRPIKTPLSIDGLILSGDVKNLEAIKKLEQLKNLGVKIFSSVQQKGFYPCFDLIDIDTKKLTHPYALVVTDESLDQARLLASLKPECLFLKIKQPRLNLVRNFFSAIQDFSFKAPLLHHYVSSDCYENLIIQCSMEIGSLLTDRLGDGIIISDRQLPLEKKVLLAFNLLQACRIKSTKTEYIACPGCGRTLFHLQEVTQKIKKQTSHLPGVKIAVMGCIVNGPGEMADADFGYVGSKKGKVDLYVGKQCVEKDIDQEIATDKLIELIKKHDRWVDPKN